MDVHLNDYMFAYIVYVYVYMRVYIYTCLYSLYIFFVGTWSEGSLNMVISK